jgi:hypothetical protein
VETEENVFRYAKSFFGFNNNNEITIIVPYVKQTRTLSLRCKNYPLFNYEISTDDAFSTFRVLGLLTAIYGQTKSISIVHNEPSFSLGKSNNIFIGGPPTNMFAYDLTRKGPLQFSENNERRSIHGLKDIYWIKFREHYNGHTNQRIFDLLSIKEDYCLISKNTINNRVEFVIGGLRAYGQKAVYEFLNDINFYRAVKSVFKYPFFRILVRVKVNDYHITKPWEIVETEYSNCKWKAQKNQLNIFLSYVSEDWDTRVRFLQKRLEKEYFDVFIDKENITVGTDWKETIRAQIEKADVFLVCFSKKYFKKQNPYLDHELDCAINQYKSIIPVRFETCRTHPFLRVRNIEWLDLFGNWRRKASDWTIKDWTREKKLRELINILYQKQLEKNLKSE